MASAVAIVVAVLSVAPVAQVRAQASEGATEDPRLIEAREAYQSGLLAAEEARWSDALGHFERAYARSSVASALFNVGTTLRALGRHREARDALTRLLEGHTLDAATTAEATRIRDEEAARVARITLDGVPGDVTLRLDGRDVDPGPARPLVLELDPGEHALEALASGHETARWQGSIADGETRVIALEMPARVVAPPAIDLSTPAPREESIVESPWLWLTIGLVVIVGVGIAVGLVLQDQAQLQPMVGTFAVRL